MRNYITVLYLFAVHSLYAQNITTTVSPHPTDPGNMIIRISLPAQGLRGFLTEALAVMLVMLKYGNIY